MKKILYLVLAAAWSSLVTQPVLAEGPNAAPPPGPGMEGRKPNLPPWLHDPGKGPREHPHLHKWMQRLQKKNPEEFHRMQTLRRENPEAFRNELQQRLQKKGGLPPDGFKGPRMGEKVRSEKLKGLEKRNRDLVQQIRAAEDSEKESIISELRLSLQATFDEREELRSNQIEQARKELDRHLAMAQERKENREKIINTQLNWLLQDKASPPDP